MQVYCFLIYFRIYIFLYNSLGFVRWGSSFPSIRPVIRPSSSSLDEEDDGTGGGRRLMAAAAVYPHDHVILLAQFVWALRNCFCVVCRNLAERSCLSRLWGSATATSPRGSAACKEDWAWRWILLPWGRISNADSCWRLHHRHPREFMSGVVGNPLKDDLRTTDASAGARPDPLLDRRAFWVISSVRLIVMPVVGIIMTTVCTLFLDLSDTQVLYCSVTSSHLWADKRGHERIHH